MNTVDSYRGFSPYGLFNILLRHWRTLVFAPFVVGVVVAGLLLILPRTYVATALFLPEESSGSDLPPGLISMAAQFQLRMGAGGTSPYYYVDLVRSVQLQNTVLEMLFGVPESPGEQRSLLSILVPNGPAEDSAEWFFAARDILNEDMSTTVNDGTGMVRLSFEAKNSELAAAVTNALLSELERFNMDIRQSREREKRVFIEGRQQEAEEELHEAEDALEAWLRQNRSVEDSPALQFELQRLNRRVEPLQEVVVTLRREYETARIAEVDNRPVITIVDPAFPPPRPARSRVVMVLASTLGAFLIAIVWVFVREFFARNRAEWREDIEETVVLWQEFCGAVPLLRGRTGREP